MIIDGDLCLTGSGFDRRCTSSVEAVRPLDLRLVRFILL